MGGGGGGRRVWGSDCSAAGSCHPPSNLWSGRESVRQVRGVGVGVGVGGGGQGQFF